MLDLLKCLAAVRGQWPFPAMRDPEYRDAITPELRSEPRFPGRLNLLTFCYLFDMFPIRFRNVSTNSIHLVVLCNTRVRGLRIDIDGKFRNGGCAVFDIVNSRCLQKRRCACQCCSKFTAMSRSNRRPYDFFIAIRRFLL